MRKRNIFLRFVGVLARRFRAFQEVWIIPCWGSGCLTAIPLWALDTLVLVIKLCSVSVMAAVRVIIPPAMKNLYGETVLITGAGAGIGRELAMQLADLGATVICWDKDTRRNNATVDEIRKKDGDCYGYTVDVTVREQVLALASRMRRQLMEITMVVSNAGALTHGPLLHLKPDAIAKLIEINLLAHFWVIQAFLPNMIDRRHGHIIAINSSAGLIPCADMVPYCAAKFGLRGLMDSISEELRLHAWTKNIHTTSVYLATVSTGLYPAPSHRFTSWFSEVTPQEAAKTIIEDWETSKVWLVVSSIRKNRKCICVPSYMKTLINFNGLMPYKIRIIFTDFFNFGHRGWFCFC